MTISPIENISGIDLGILGTHLGFIDALVPDEHGNLPRNADGDLVVFAGSREICELSPVKVDAIQISSFGGTKSDDIDELINNLKSLGLEAQLVMMVGGVNPMNPDDEDGAVDCDDSECESSSECYVFEPTAFGLTFVGGFDGEGLVSYAGQDSAGAPFDSDPYVIVDFYTQDYFDTQGDERYTCTWYGDITELAVTSMPTATVTDGSAGPDLWIGFEVGLTVSMVDDGSGQMVAATNCESFDAEVWGSEDPTTVIESLIWGMGAGPLDAAVEDSLSTNYPDEWAESLGAELYGGYYGAGAAQGTITTSGLNYCFGIEMEVVYGVATISYDENGDAISRELGEDYTDDALPPYTLINCNSWYLPYTTMMGI